MTILSYTLGGTRRYDVTVLTFSLSFNEIRRASIELTILALHVTYIRTELAGSFKSSVLNNPNSMYNVRIHSYIQTCVLYLSTIGHFLNIYIQIGVLPFSHNLLNLQHTIIAHKYKQQSQSKLIRFSFRNEAYSRRSPLHVCS